MWFYFKYCVSNYGIKHFYQTKKKTKQSQITKEMIITCILYYESNVENILLWRTLLFKQNILIEIYFSAPSVKIITHLI